MDSLETAPWRDRYLALKRMLALRDCVEGLWEEVRASGDVVVQPLRLPETRGLHPLHYLHVDRFALESGTGEISGWAFVPDWDPRLTSVVLQLEGPAKFLLPGAPKRRPDVVAAHAQLPELAGKACLAGLEASGFRAFFRTQAFPPGTYSPRIWLVHPLGSASGLAKSVINVGSNSEQSKETCASSLT